MRGAAEVEPVGVHSSLPGSYISVVFTAEAAMPPTSSTRPSLSRVAECPPLSDRRSAPSVQEPDAGSKISTLFIRPALSSPPAISTRPSWSRVAVWRVLAWRMALVGDHVSVDGSYISPWGDAPNSSEPPITSSLPSESVVAVCPWRLDFMCLAYVSTSVRWHGCCPFRFGRRRSIFCWRLFRCAGDESDSRETEEDKGPCQPEQSDRGWETLSVELRSRRG